MAWPLKPRPLLFFVEVVSFVCCLSMHEALVFFFVIVTFRHMSFKSLAASTLMINLRV